MKWITASHIKTWASSQKQNCREKLPELVRRLILAHAKDSIDDIDFPCGDSITEGGWDGKLITSAHVPFFPSGISGWEFGTKVAVKGKADEDYEKRSNDPQGFTPKDTTYVTVTPHAWPSAEKWEREKRAEKKWKDVRVINADKLEQWLDYTPGVALWLAREIGGIPSNGIRDIESFWEEFALSTDPELTPELVIGGRVRDMNAIHRWVLGKPELLEVEADDVDEAYAFLYACIFSLPENDKIRALSRCILVEDPNDLRSICTTYKNYPLIIIAPGSCIDPARVAANDGHHVFISTDSKAIGIRSRPLRLSRPIREAVEHELHKKGLSRDRSISLSRDFGRSIPVLRRHLSKSQTFRSPSWANSTNAQILLPALFAGAWNDEKDKDREILEVLSGLNYEDFTKRIQDLLFIDDTPIRKIGNIWMLKSPLDVWFILAKFLTPQTLKLYNQAVLAVLSKTDPKYDLPAEQRWASALYGKSNPYSEWIRTGLVESLVLLAVYGDDRSTHVPSTQLFVNEIVNQIFTSANTWEAWSSLSDETPLLAEAAPDIFLKILDTRISKNKQLFIELMKDDASLFGECKHAGLLWALESLAWNEDYFLKSVQLLGKLVDIDPGGRWANRPISSLKEIFQPRFPQTYATPETRIVALKSIIDNYPKIVWKFTSEYFSNNVFSETHRFRWRDSGGDRRGLEPEDEENNVKYQKLLMPILSDLACLKDNLIETAKEFNSLPNEFQNMFISTLERFPISDFSSTEIPELLQHLRETLNWINSYGKESIRQHVPKLYKLLEKFEPTNPIDRLGWLLSTPWPQLPEGYSEQYSERQSKVEEEQNKAAREILNSSSIKEILDFAKKIQFPGVLGFALGSVVKNVKEDSSLLDSMSKEPDEYSILIRSFAEARIKKVGEVWISKQITRMKKKKVNLDFFSALLFLGLPEGIDTWDKVETQGKKVEEYYWKLASGHSRGNGEKDSLVAINKLLDAGRPENALEIAGDPKLSLPSQLLQRLINEYLNKLDEEKGPRRQIDDYLIGSVFRQIYDANELPLEEIAKLEWPFANLFDEIRQFTNKPLAIHRLLQNDPSFFTQLVSFIYKRDDHSPDPELDKLEHSIIENRAKGAYAVLNTWNLIPGFNEDGTVDETKLTNWVKLARTQCFENKKTIGCDLQLASIFAQAPTDKDGAWPHVAIRNQIELLADDSLDRHIIINIRNNRGVTTRGILDGGKQERELADKYMQMSNIVKTKWPRTALILKSLAESYESDAKAEDIQADLNDLKWS